MPLSHCASLVTHRLICNMTYLGENVTARGLDLKSNADRTVQSSCICCNAPWQEDHDDARNMSLVVLVQKLFANNVKIGYVALC